MAVSRKHLEQIPARIAALVFGATLVAAVMTAAVCAVPLYRDLRHQREMAALDKLRLKVEGVQAILRDSLRAAREYCMIEHYLRQEAVVEDYWSPAFGPPPARAVPDIAKIDLSRVKGVVSAGHLGAPSGPGSESMPTWPDTEGRPGLASQSALQSLFYVNDRCNVSVLVRCSGGSAETSTDLVFCDVSDLEGLLLDTSNIAKSARLWLVDAPHEAVRFLVPAIAQRNSSGTHQPDALLGKAIAAIKDSPGRPWSFIKHPEGRLAVSYLGLPGSEWALLLTMDEADLYQPARRKMFLLVGATLVLAIAVSVVAYLTARPLIGHLAGVAENVAQERLKRRASAIAGEGSRGSTGEAIRNLRAGDEGRVGSGHEALGDRLLLQLAWAARTGISADLAQSAMRSAAELLENNRKQLEMTLAMFETGLENVWEARDAIGKAIDQTHSAANRLRRLGRQFSKAAGEVAKADPAALAVAATETARPKAEEKGVYIRVETAEALPQITCNETVLEQILLILISHAVNSFEHDGCTDQQLTVAVAGSTTDGFIDFSVEDNGPGISNREIDQLFEPLCEENAQSPRVCLTVARLLVESFGGRIGAAGNESGGMTFTVSVPI